MAGVKQARGYCEDVEYSPEDATRTEPDFLCQVVEATIAAGATTVNIPDTVGYATPHHMGEVIRTLYNRVPNIDRAVISVHCHNDLGLAVANSLVAVEPAPARWSVRSTDWANGPATVRSKRS